MSSNNEGNVEEKFFFNLDLMEKFLPFMDSHSVLLLCKSKISCAFAILHDSNTPSVWKKMIDRSISETPDVDVDVLHEARTQTLPLISLLKMMQAKDNYDTNHDTLTILEAVCEKSSADFQTSVGNQDFPGIHPAGDI